MTEPASPVVPEAPAPAPDSQPTPAAAPQASQPVPATPARGLRPWLTPALLNLVSFAVVVLPSVHYFRLWLQVRGERTVALMNSIPWPFYLLAMLAVVGLAVFTVIRAVRGDSPDSPRFRLLPIAAVLFISTELFVIEPPTMLLPPDTLITMQLRALEDGVVTADGLLPPDPVLFAKAMPALPPPFRRDGAQLSGWNYVVRTDCAGPVTQLPVGTEPGTMLACLAPDRRSVWLTAVGLDGQHAGPAKLVGEPGQSAPLAVQVRAISEAEAEAEALDSMNDLPADAIPEDESASPGEP